MSVSTNGRQVVCDGAGCSARADVPIALRPLLGDDRAAERIGGWLFAARRGQWRHYCPACLPRYLDTLDTPPSLVK